jgi:hypothetical protein
MVTSRVGTVVPLGDGISDYEDDDEMEVDGDQSEPHLGPEAVSHSILNGPLGGSSVYFVDELVQFV